MARAKPGASQVRWIDGDATDLDVHGMDLATLTSDVTLRFRERAEVESDLRRTGFTVTDVRDAPDRPGREFVFVAACV